jgi:hypothetical protein
MTEEMAIIVVDLMVNQAVVFTSRGMESVGFVTPELAREVYGGLLVRSILECPLPDLVKYS